MIILKQKTKPLWVSESVCCREAELLIKLTFRVCQGRCPAWVLHLLQPGEKASENWHHPQRPLVRHVLENSARYQLHFILPGTCDRGYLLIYGSVVAKWKKRSGYKTANYKTAKSQNSDCYKTAKSQNGEK